jgi:hypothetical protein
MVMVEVGGDSVPCLPGKRYVLPSPPGATGNTSTGPPIMVRCRSSGPSWVGPMTMAPEPPPRGERLRLSNQTAMNSRLPKQMVFLRGKPSPGERSPPVTGANADDGTIRTA